MRGGCTRRSREVCAASCRHQSGNLARNCSRLSPLGVGRIAGNVTAARADWASLMACSSATGSNWTRYSLSAAFISTLTASCCISRSQGVAGGLYRLTTLEPCRVFPTNLNDGWK